MTGTTTSRFPFPAWLSPGTSLRVLYVLLGTEVASFIPFFALLLRDRGLRPDRIGLVLAAMSISGLLASTLLAHAADVVWGRLAALRATAMLAAGMALLLNVVGSEMAATLFAAIGLSICWAPIVPLSDAIALQHLGTGRRQAYGQIRLWMSIGFSLAALAFGGLYAWVGLEGMPIAFGIALLVFALWTIIADLPSSPPLRDRNDPKIWALGALFRSAPRLFAVLLASLLVAIGVNATLTFVPLRIGGLGGGPVLVGLAMALAAAVEVPVMAFSARLVRRIGLKGCFVLAALQYAIAFLAISILSSPAAITVVFATDGIGFALLYVSMVIAVDALGAALISSHRPGTAPDRGPGSGSHPGRGWGRPSVHKRGAESPVLGCVDDGSCRGSHRLEGPLRADHVPRRGRRRSIAHRWPSNGRRVSSRLREPQRLLCHRPRNRQPRERSPQFQERADRSDAVPIFHTLGSYEAILPWEPTTSCRGSSEREPDIDVRSRTAGGLSDEGGSTHGDAQVGKGGPGYLRGRVRSVGGGRQGLGSQPLGR